ncbi:hypothetical protein [Moorena sp. SIOASIH]|nr:hypothetical protein [Moorena sp. SIOASIH]
MILLSYKKNLKPYLPTPDSRLPTPDSRLPNKIHLTPFRSM